MFGPAISCHFKASVFQMFQQDGDGCIKARLFLAYLSQRAAMIHMVRTSGSLLSPVFQPSGCSLAACSLRSESRWAASTPTTRGCSQRASWRTFWSKQNPSLLTILLSLIPHLRHTFFRHYSRTVPSLEGIQPSFLPLYRRIAARKLLFFHGHNGSLRIKDLVASQALMSELSELRIPDQSDDQLLGSWFSLQVCWFRGVDDVKWFHHFEVTAGTECSSAAPRSPRYGYTTPS